MPPLASESLGYLIFFALRCFRILDWLEALEVSSVEPFSCSVRRKRLDLRAMLQHASLHAHVSFLIHLISRFSIRLKVDHVHLLWLRYVPVRGLLTLSILWLSSDLRELS